jgi:hypothetical protein
MFSSSGVIASSFIGETWTPLEIPNLTLILDAALGVTGDPVTQWSDVTHSLNFNSVISPDFQASDSNLNGEPSVVCNVTDNRLLCSSSITFAWFGLVAYYPSTIFTSFDAAFAAATAQPYRGISGSADWRTLDLAANRWRDGTSTSTALDVANAPHLYEVEPTSGSLTRSDWGVGRDPGNTGRQWRGGIGLILGASSMPDSTTRTKLRNYCQNRFGTP